MNKPAANFLTSKCMETYQRLSEKDFEVLSNLHVLQSLYNATKTNISPKIDESAKNHIIMITTNLIEILRNYYVECLEPPNKYNPSAECKSISDSIIGESPTESSSASEKLVYERQMLAVIALFCADFPIISESLLFDRLEIEQQQIDGEIQQIGVENGNESFIKVITDVLRKIGYSVSFSFLCL